MLLSFSQKILVGVLFPISVSSRNHKVRGKFCNPAILFDLFLGEKFSESVFWSRV